MRLERHDFLKSAMFIFLVLAAILYVTLEKFNEKSIVSLDKLDGDDRLTYLSEQDTSVIVAYLCNSDVFRVDVVNDLNRSLRIDHGVQEVTCKDGTQHLIAE